MKPFIHETSIIDEDVEIGEDTRVWQWCHIASGAKIGRNCVLGQNVYVGVGVKIGDGVKIENNVSVFESVTLEADVFCGPGCVFTNVKRPRSALVGVKKRTLVQKGATIGANATVVCGVTIGKYVFVGAGAVVTKNVLDYGMIYGNPAKLRGWVCECGGCIYEIGEYFGAGFHATLACSDCGKMYEIEKGVCRAL